LIQKEKHPKNSEAKKRIRGSLFSDVGFGRSQPAPAPFGGKRSHSRFGAHLGRYILACTDLVAAFPICGPQPRLAPIISTLMLSFGWFLHLSS